MSWITITAADVEARIPANLLAAIRERWNEEGSDPMALIIRDVVARVRGAISTCKSYSLDKDTTLLPPEMIDDAAYLVVAGLLMRMGDATPVGDALKTRLGKAEEHLIAVSKCEFAVSLPAAPQDTPSAQIVGKVSLVSSTDRRNTRARLSGLI